MNRYQPSHPRVFRFAQTILVILSCVIFGKVIAAEGVKTHPGTDAVRRVSSIHEPVSAETIKDDSLDAIKWLRAEKLESSENAATVQEAIPTCNDVIVANVVAIDQVQTYNRFGAFNPAGMQYALARDVVQNSAGVFQLRPGKRPRPIVLRVNVGDCLQVNFTNRLQDPRPDENSTATRNASMHVNGLDYVDSIKSDGANVGNNPSSLVKPGDSTTYTWYAARQGQYMINSMGAAAGGEGDGGQVDLGLFGSVNVEPRGSKWYRSQVTAAQLNAAIVPTPNDLLKINYEAVFPLGHPDAGFPVLNMRKGNEAPRPGRCFPSLRRPRVRPP